MSILHTAAGLAALHAMKSDNEMIDPYDFVARIADRRGRLEMGKKPKSAKRAKANAKAKAAHKARIKQRKTK